MKKLFDKIDRNGRRLTVLQEDTGEIVVTVSDNVSSVEAYIFDDTKDFSTFAMAITTGYTMILKDDLGDMVKAMKFVRDYRNEEVNEGYRRIEKIRRIIDERNTDIELLEGTIQRYDQIEETNVEDLYNFETAIPITQEVKNESQHSHRA